MVGALPWLLEAALCPEDGGTLVQDGEGVRCGACEREFAPQGDVLVLLPDRLAHVNNVNSVNNLNGPPEPGAHSQDEGVRWIEDELAWWNPWHENVSLKPSSPRAGLRGRSRERNLLRHVRPRLTGEPLAIEMGAGTSRTIAGLWPRGLRYVATDISLPALQSGRRILGPEAASVQCDAVAWPFREACADVVLVLGVLHHLSDWRAALERACATVRPGGFLLLHEAITKPRVLARFRSHGVDDPWVSPHEGDVPASALRSELARYGTIMRWSGEESPLRFALVRYVIERFGLLDRLETSAALTVALNALDQLWGRTLGRIAPSLGFNEVSVVWQRPAETGAPAGAADAQRRLRISS
jgi:SAM-dependent methyltransferase